jgi:Ca2+:H+ antiporter
MTAKTIHPAPRAITVMSFLRGNSLNWLLLFVPISIGMEIAHAPALWIFITAALAIIPLAGIIGGTTEALSSRVGPGLGGLLNATFGNATELIISLFALRIGLFDVVKASISGAIIGNLLLVLGASMLVGGWGRDKQTFNRVHAGAQTAMLFLAVVALVMPAIFDLVEYRSLTVGAAPADVTRLSLLVSIVLMLTYIGSLIFSLKTHRNVITTETEEEGPHLPMAPAMTLLAIVTVVTAVEAEFLVGAIHEATVSLGMTPFFVGVIVVAIIGNAAEHFSAVVMARKNKMELSVTIATASSTQIALFVAPVLVFASYAFGQPMSLVFNAFEIVGIGLSVLIVSLVSLDGESNWFEGLQLLAVYLILAIVFFFVRG